MRYWVSAIGILWYDRPGKPVGKVVVVGFCIRGVWPLHSSRSVGRVPMREDNEHTHHAGTTEGRDKKTRYNIASFPGSLTPRLPYCAWGSLGMRLGQDSEGTSL